MHAMSRCTRLPPRRDEDRSRSLGEVRALAWLLDNSIPVPGTRGRRFGIDAIIGLVPGVGDLASGAIGLFVIWRASRMGLPRVVVARMLANAGLDFVIGAIPLAGDAFDLWFKSNTRNLELARRHLEAPESSTRGDWLALAGIMGAVVLAVVLVVWLTIALLGAVVGLFS